MRLLLQACALFLVSALAATTLAATTLTATTLTATTLTATTLTATTLTATTLTATTESATTEKAATEEVVIEEVATETVADRPAAEELQGEVSRQGSIPSEILLDVPLDVPLDSDRPGFCLSPVTIQAGRFQAEAGVTWSRRGETETWTLGESLFRLGLTTGWELRLRLDSYRFVDRPEGRLGGWEDLSVGIKRRLSTGSGESGRGVRPAAAVVVETTLPTGTGDFGGGGLRPAAALVLSWAAGPWRVASTVRSAWRKEEDRFFEGSGGLLVGRSLGERPQVFAEAFTFVRDREHGGDDPFLQAGLIYRIYDFQLDVRLGRGVGGDRDPGDDTFAGAGFLIKW